MAKAKNKHSNDEHGHEGYGNNVGISPELSYVMAWNLQEAEFPVNIEIFSLDSGIPPLMVTLTQNGMMPIGGATASSSNRRWARVQVSTPDSVQAPLIVELIVLHPSEIEPPVTTTSQYIRVVIRNYQIPQGELPTSHRN
jgi:hypothetical protein